MADTVRKADYDPKAWKQRTAALCQLYKREPTDVEVARGLRTLAEQAQEALLEEGDIQPGTEQGGRPHMDTAPRSPAGQGGTASTALERLKALRSPRKATP